MTPADVSSKTRPIERGDHVRLRHLPASMKPPAIEVTEVMPKGFIRLSGWAGYFAAHLFVVVEKTKGAA